jgi:hypothetical protein
VICSWYLDLKKAMAKEKTDLLAKSFHLRAHEFHHDARLGANLTNDEKRAHLADLKREHLIAQVCIQEILPPEDS